MNIKIPALLAMDVADPDSEISAFVHECFLDFLVTKVPEDKIEEVLKTWETLEKEEDQEQFLKTIDPEFMKKFQIYVTKELGEVIGSVRK